MTSEFDILQQEYRFIRDDLDSEDEVKDTKVDQKALRPEMPDDASTVAESVCDDSKWRKNLAKRHYKKLYREYCICDLSRYKEGAVGLRWRVESEVVSGKGQYICGNVTCKSRGNLTTFEVPFEYVEDNEVKRALVKAVLCKKCGKRLKKQRKYKKALMEKARKKELKREIEKLKKRMQDDA